MDWQLVAWYFSINSTDFFYGVRTRTQIAYPCGQSYYNDEKIIINVISKLYARWDTTYSYTSVCPPVQGDHTRALASEFCPLQASKPW